MYPLFQHDALPGVCVETIQYKHTPIICVLGVLANQRGLEIKNEMLKWIVTKYDCIAVNQEPPGVLFEYPGLLIAQQTSIITNKPVLYLHTKGAAHSTNVYNQATCREVWRREFIDHYDEYLLMMGSAKSVMACPFTGKTRHTTWLNGFMATPNGWAVAQNIVPPENGNRFPYEHCFKDVNIKAYGRIMNNVESYPEPGGNAMVRYINGFV